MFNLISVRILSKARFTALDALLLSPMDQDSISLEFQNDSVGHTFCFLEQGADSEHEFVELMNPYPFDIHVGGWQLGDGIACTFPEDTWIEAEGFLVTANDTAVLAFLLRSHFAVGRHQDSDQRNTSKSWIRVEFTYVRRFSRSRRNIDFHGKLMEIMEFHDFSRLLGSLGS